MDPVLASKPVCPGIRFYPTNEELFMFYLKRKVRGKSFPCQMMSEVDVYRYAPWDLPDKSCPKTKDLYWFFFCPHAKKHGNGHKTPRLTEFGFWKSTGNDRTVKYCGRTVGMIKTLVFHQGKAQDGDRTNWVMYEYRLVDKLLADKGIPLDSYVICKVFQKSGVGPRNGEDYGAPFVEEDWESEDEDNMTTDQEPIRIPDSVVPTKNLNVIPSFSSEPSSVTGIWTPLTMTEQTVSDELAQLASDDEDNMKIDQEPVPLLENVVPADNLNAVNTSVALPLSCAEPNSITATRTSVATDQTIAVDFGMLASVEPLPSMLLEPLDEDCFGGLEDLWVNGSCSNAGVSMPQWQADWSAGYLELDDLQYAYSFPAFCEWSKPTVEDTDGFIELDDLK